MKRIATVTFILGLALYAWGQEKPRIVTGPAISEIWTDAKPWTPKLYRCPKGHLHNGMEWRASYRRIGKGADLARLADEHIYRACPYCIGEAIERLAPAGVEVKQ